MTKNVYTLDHFRDAVDAEYSHMTIAVPDGEFNLVNPLRMKQEQRQGLVDAVDGLTPEAEVDENGKEVLDDNGDVVRKQMSDDEQLEAGRAVLMAACNDQRLCQQFVDAIGDDMLVMFQVINEYVAKANLGEA